MDYGIVQVVNTSTGPAQIIHSQKSSLSQQQRTDMHEGQLPYLRYQIVLITQCCLPNHVQLREHYTGALHALSTIV